MRLLTKKGKNSAIFAWKSLSYQSRHCVCVLNVDVHNTSFKIVNNICGKFPRQTPRFRTIAIKMNATLVFAYKLDRAIWLYLMVIDSEWGTCFTIRLYPTLRIFLFLTTTQNVMLTRESFFSFFFLGGQCYITSLSYLHATIHCASKRITSLEQRLLSKIYHIQINQMLIDTAKVW